MLYIYNISIVSIDLRYFLCGITKVKCANQLLTSEQLTYYTISKSWLSCRQHKNQPSTIGYLHTLTFWSHSLVKNSINIQNTTAILYTTSTLMITFWDKETSRLVLMPLIHHVETQMLSWRKHQCRQLQIAQGVHP